MSDPGFWQGRRVLVTGHAGFKGSWLTLWLQRLGAQVTGFGGPSAARPAAHSIHAQARVAEGLADSLDGDVRDPAAVDAAVRRARPEVVLHLAGVSQLRGSLRDPVRAYAVNVMGTVHLLDAVRRLGDDVRAVVCVTSDKCYEVRGRDRPHREDEALGGRDPYSSSKACQEMVTAAYRDSLLSGRDVRVATVRAGNVVGGGDWAGDRLVPDLVRAGLAGQPLEVRAPDAVRPWQHVLSPLDGYLTLTEGLLGDDGDALATAWNFGPPDGDGRSVRWVVEYLSQRWPGGIETHFKPQEDAESYVMRIDSSRARERLGWSPPWDLERSLDATLSWYVRHHAGEDARDLCEEQIAAYATTGRGPGAGAPTTPGARRSDPSPSRT